MTIDDVAASHDTYRFGALIESKLRQTYALTYAQDLPQLQTHDIAVERIDVRLDVTAGGATVGDGVESEHEHCAAGALGHMIVAVVLIVINCGVIQRIRHVAPIVRRDYRRVGRVFRNPPCRTFRRGDRSNGGSQRTDGIRAGGSVVVCIAADQTTRQQIKMALR